MPAQNCPPYHAKKTPAQRIFPLILPDRPMTERVFNVLFLCTGNSARSILAEALLNQAGKGRFKAYSAGSHPKGQINPFALELLEKHDFPVSELRSKPWDKFSAPGAPELDFV